MSKKENYSAKIDEALINFFKKADTDKSVLPFDERLVKTGHYKKVAFDLYRVDNDPYNNLWLLEDIDGKSHLVRASDPQYEIKEAGSWNAVSDFDKKNITLTYKKVPIVRFSSDEYGFNSDNIMTFKVALLERITKDKSFLKDVILEQPSEKISALVETFPEFKFVKES